MYFNKIASSKDSQIYKLSRTKYEEDVEKIIFLASIILEAFKTRGFRIS